MREGHTADALAWHERAYTVRERLVGLSPGNVLLESDLALSEYYLGGVHDRMGRPAEALEWHERARTIREWLAWYQPSVIHSQTELLETYDALYRLRIQAGRRAPALAVLELARTVLERLVHEHPESAGFTASLATTLHDMASIDLDEQRFDKARAEILQAIEWQRKHQASNPGNPDSRQRLDDHLSLLIRAAQGLGHTDEAAQATRERDALRASDRR
jgi:tetratricopeptide (TPR) repeat protein